MLSARQRLPAQVAKRATISELTHWAVGAATCSATRLEVAKQHSARFVPYDHLGRVLQLLLDGGLHGLTCCLCVHNVRSCLNTQFVWHCVGDCRVTLDACRLYSSTDTKSSPSTSALGRLGCVTMPWVPPLATLVAAVCGSAATAAAFHLAPRLQRLCRRPRHLQHRCCCTDRHHHAAPTAATAAAAAAAAAAAVSSESSCYEVWEDPEAQHKPSNPR